MIRQGSLKEWLIEGGLEIDGKKGKCPACKTSTIRFQYVGDLSTRIGYLDIWCDSCLNGVHVSRAKVPENIEMLPFDTPSNVLKQKIPEIKYIQHMT